MTRPSGIRNNAYIMLALAPLFWAGNHVVGRAIAGQVPPAGLSVFRWILVFLLLTPLIRTTWRRDWAGIVERPGAVLLLALIGGAAFSTLQYVALIFTTAINVSVMNSVTPALIVLTSVLIFRDRVRSVQLIGIAISLAGVLVIVAQGSWALLAGLTFNFGDLLVFLNMTLWAIFSACLRLRPEISGFGFMAALAAISAVANVPFAIWEHAIGFPLQLTWSTVLAIGYAGVFTSFLGYAAWSRGIELIGAPRAGPFMHLVPLYASLLAWLLLGESLRLFHVCGLVLILTGVTLAARRS
ncbi:MAG: DMT family transporter [Hyphomicrobiaceae bacterium]|nr:DMT family transporter [Hyphomicrobiaceae bacterium]